jgi:PAS domain-containing protein
MDQVLFDELARASHPVQAELPAQDITARRQAEAEVQQSEERFRTLANSIPQLAWMARADGFILWYNQRWYDYTGTTPEQMEGWGWQSVHDPTVLPGRAEAGGATRLRSRSRSRWSFRCAGQTERSATFSPASSR